MKYCILFILSIITIATHAQKKYYEHDFIDASIKKLYIESETCLKTTEKNCKNIFVEAINIGKKKKVAYMDFLYFQLGYFFDLTEQFDSSLHYTKYAYQLSNKKDTLSAYRIIINSLGANYFRNGNYDSAIKYMLLTVELEETRNNRPIYLAYAYNNLGVVLGINENYAEAVGYFKKGFYLLEKIKDTTIIANIASNTAIYLKKLDKINEAQEWASKALVFAEKYNNASAYCYANYILGTSEKNIDKALAYLKLAIDKARVVNMKVVLADALDIYGVKLSEKGKMQEAALAIEEAILLHKNANYTTGLIAAYKNAGLIYYRKGNFKLSSEYYQEYTELYTKTIPEENKKRITELTTKFETEKKEKLLAEQQLIIQKKHTQFKNVIFISIVLLLAVLFYIVYIRKVQKQKLKLLKQENENAILNAVINSEEQERKNISSNLHDSVAAKLGSAKMSLQAIPFLSEEKKAEQLEKTAQLISNIHKDVRNIAHNLLPVTLEKEGLIAAVNEYVDEINQLKIINIETFIDSVRFTNLPKRNEIIIYRIIQELINNIVKHANATKASIHITSENNQLNIKVADNGIGFTTNKENQGLYSIKERITAINGSFKINSEEGNGTTVSLSLNV